MKTLIYIGLLPFLLTACGDKNPPVEGQTFGPEDPETELVDIKNRIDYLTVVAGSLDALVRSDFSTCPASGDTSDPLIQKICQVAQASTIESQVELQNEIGIFANELQNEIDSLSTDMANANASLIMVQASLINLQTDIGTLAARMTSAEAAIIALQNLTASISGTLNGTMIAVSIGEENVSAGPFYEAVLRRVDKKRFNGYVEAFGSYLSFGNNPVSATNGSTSAVFSFVAHGYLAGDLVDLSGLVSGRGFLTGDVTGQYSVLSVTANTFTITFPRAATSSGTLGGANGLVRKVNGRGMATLWKSDDASDIAVRVTSAGSKRYNFIIRRIASDLTNDSAELCYDTTNRGASYVTINAANEGGSGNVICK